MRLKGAILSSCHGEQEGPLTPRLPNYMCLSFHYHPPRPHFRSFSSAVLDMARNLYAAQEATVTTRHETMDCFQIGKGVRQGCILSLCLFNLYAEYIMRKAELRKHKLEPRLLGEISITSDTQMTPPFWQKVKRN